MKKLKKFKNFCRALTNLHEIETKSPPYDVITTAGMVALFAICFEQSWRAMKETLKRQGFDEKKIDSPRKIIKQAFAAGMIDDEELWLEMLTARTNATHSYNAEEVAPKIIYAVQKKFIALFEALKTEIEIINGIALPLDATSLCLKTEIEITNCAALPLDATSLCCYV